MAGTSKRQWVVHVVLITMLFLTFLPYLFMVMTSTKTNAQMVHQTWIPTWPIAWANYAGAWGLVSRDIVNTLIVAGTSIAGILTTATLAAYAFARLRFRGKEVLYMLILALLMVPSVLMLIPLYLEIVTMRLTNNYFGLILPYIAMGQPFTILLTRGAIATLPEELFEAARLDGASEWIALRAIAVPLIGPVLISAGIMNFLTIWNDYVLPFVVMNDPNKWTVSLGVAQLQASFGVTPQWGVVFAGYVIATIPLLVIFVLGMRYFVRGLTSASLSL
ncbi:MAG: carbohydrate ABC transporter permease [Thermaerobacter sp.]|nr:carbohydrate ABC transporter permease [Thermaerobacter sp.]